MDGPGTDERPSWPPPPPRSDVARRARTAVARPSVVSLAAASVDPAVCATWDRLSSACDHPNAFHGSRAWAEYLVARGRDVRVAVVRDRSGAVSGVVPLMCHPYGLDYDLGAQRLLRSRCRVADVLGSLPLLAGSAVTKDTLLRGILDALPDCDAVFFESLPVESVFSSFDDVPASLLPYRSSAARADHLVELGGTFDVYWEARSPKLRFNVERSLRTLRGAGSLELRCYRSPADVDRLFTDARHVRRRSWQFETLGDLNDDPVQSSHESLSELARRDLLRSYVLYVDDAPVAFVIGYQHDGVFFYGVVGYDAALSRHSPGIVLLHLLMKELFASDRPRLVSFGRGNDDYKRRFGTRQRHVGTVFFFRSTLRNRMRVQNHRVFSQAKGLIAELRVPSPHRLQ